MRAGREGKGGGEKLYLTRHAVHLAKGFAARNGGCGTIRRDV